MEKLAVIKDTHNKSITALSYNPMKHEILVGFEGTMQMRNKIVPILRNLRYKSI